MLQRPQSPSNRRRYNRFFLVKASFQCACSHETDTWQTSCLVKHVCGVEANSWNQAKIAQEERSPPRSLPSASFPCDYPGWLCEAWPVSTANNSEGCPNALREDLIITEAAHPFIPMWTAEPFENQQGSGTKGTGVSTQVGANFARALRPRLRNRKRLGEPGNSHLELISDF